MRRGSLIACSLLLLGQTDEVQLFDYGEQVVVRQMTTEERYGPGGWDVQLLECYVDGEMTCQCGVTIVLEHTEICRTADLDGDGDVDLADFAEFQREFER